MRNYKKISIVIACIASLSMFPQKVKEANADKSYDKFAYVDAIKTYERVVGKGYKSQDLLQKLGNAYYFKADLVKAAKWYGELFTFSQNIEPEYYYRYAQSLKGVKDYAKADAMITKFEQLKGTDLRAKLAINQKDYLEKIKKNSGRYNVENAGINSKFSDFGSAFFNNKIVFASARDTGSFSNRRHLWTGEGFTNLYKANIISEGFLAEANKFSPDLNSRVNESTPVFTKNRKTVYFTRNNFIKGKLGKDTEKTTLLKLYTATLEGEKWTNIKEMPFNSNNYSVAHPALSFDEHTLYFVSDMPGTLGQSDLFKIAINFDGSFGAPTNLGNKINTEGRETFPMITSDGELYFASDGHPGLGGLDIFVSKMDNKDNLGEVINVGEPVNSSFDDFAFLINEKTQYGYFTSNRIGGKGGDDIYKFKETQKLIIKCEQNLSGLVTEKETVLPQADAKVSLMDTDFKTLKEVLSDKDGKFDFGLKECKTIFYIKVEKQEFVPTQTNAITIKEDEASYLEIPLEKTAIIIKKGDDLMKKFNITIIHFDLGKYNIRPDAEVELNKILDVLEQFPQMEIDIRSHTDSRQSAEKNRILSQSRASATMDWLIKKGITKKRLTAKGFGETQLINKCSDGVNCTEEEHQANRRSEFIVTKI
ncbi:OmpA family protein [Flavobacterium sp.]|uniref:OmpA family protein n=1 Tax=Flavobacterium sp. TaxID=239 RepID=UPI003BBF5DAC